MSIIEKLGIEPIEEVELWVKKGRWCAASKVRKVEQQNADMLEALIDIATGKKMHFDIRSVIEKATEKSWKEIRELV